MKRILAADWLSPAQHVLSHSATCCFCARVARRLLVLNYYPFLQKYVAPHVRDVTLVLTALVGAAHELVPPDVLSPVLRQLVDQFVHDK